MGKSQTRQIPKANQKNHQQSQESSSNPLKSAKDAENQKYTGEKRERSREKTQLKQNKQETQKLFSQSVQHNQKGRGPQSESDSDYADELEMQKMMGFSSFGSSKGKDHTKSSVEGVLKNSSVRRKYRQYMNRRGQTTRKLDDV